MKIICLTVAKKTQGNTSMFQKTSGIETIYATEVDITTFHWSFLTSQNADKFHVETIQCFRIIRVWKNFMNKKGTSLTSVETF